MKTDPRPFLSIVTVSRNNLRGLQKTYHSLQDQSFRNFEWIVIDGASQDGSCEFLQTTNAIWTSEQDAGIYDAMNKGLVKTTGDYILFLNAGDILAEKNTLQKLKDVDTDFVYGDAQEETPNGSLFYKTARTHERLALGMFTHHQAMLYRRAALNNLRFNTNYKIAADYDFTCRFLKTAATAVYIPIPICIFERGGVSQQQTTLGRRESYAIREKLGLCGPLANMLIRARQKLAVAMKTKMPEIYFSIRKRVRN
jgi:putative colanic acid biosynthesis glycosyltransferase